jgi:uncharacterized membrane protein YfcA
VAAADFLLILVGLLAGGLSGMVGVGGGIIIVPALVLLFGFGQKYAQGTTLAMLALPVGLLGAITYYRAGLVHFRASLWLAAGFIIGSVIAAHYAVKAPEHIMTRVFGGLLLAVALKLLVFGR